MKIDVPPEIFGRNSMEFVDHLRLVASGDRANMNGARRGDAADMMA
jgi:hypothetical protein